MSSPIAVSAAARHFIDRFFPGDYRVIPNGVDLSRFTLPVTPCTLRDDFGIPCTAFLVGVVARDHVIVAAGGFYSFVEAGRWRR